MRVRSSPPPPPALRAEAGWAVEAAAGAADPGAPPFNMGELEEAVEEEEVVVELLDGEGTAESESPPLGFLFLEGILGL